MGWMIFVVFWITFLFFFSGGDGDDPEMWC